MLCVRLEAYYSFLQVNKELEEQILDLKDSLENSENERMAKLSSDVDRLQRELTDKNEKFEE